ncbi:5-formyltetrahydrofolate cyclo-ligase [Tumebacillus permanentifrigoris]|uniref:5-formyltetrahydrofolate cyclo-ligase n=1 Tax=Tumebacillus permanentifrigoris TaxID=378543 RepID=A0A316D5T6_9BACL|nr:5-formyltetrahydrofolate cyclo-ligase [Tumebacillus permanentifrigoris]PWK09620.1 5-formyltetrahydrofolate cyclo-ligase [Tumebacillus permanentifrigoris]
MNPLDKKALRRRLLEARQALPAQKRAEQDQQILAHLTALPELQAARTVLVYLDFKAEVSSHGLIEWALAQGKTVCAPVTFVEERRMIPVRLRAADDVVSGAYGIREPRLGASLRVEQQDSGSNNASPHTLATVNDPADRSVDRDIVALDDIDAVILPGVGFDRAGGRLGYGGGYYDRFLPRLRPAVTKIAVAYELQMLAEVPSEHHDSRVDTVVTEAAVYRVDS